MHDQGLCDAHVLGFRTEEHRTPGATAGASYHAYLEGVRRVRKTDRVGRTAITGIPGGGYHPAAGDEFATAKARGPASGGDARAGPRYGEKSTAGLRGSQRYRQRRYQRRQFGGQQRRHRARTGIKRMPRAFQFRSTHGVLRADARPDLMNAGKSGDPASIKLIYSMGGDSFNQAPPTFNKMWARLDGVEFMVAQDHFWTPTARCIGRTSCCRRQPSGGASATTVHHDHGPAAMGTTPSSMSRPIAPMGECRQRHRHRPRKLRERLGSREIKRKKQRRNGATKLDAQGRGRIRQALRGAEKGGAPSRRPDVRGSLRARDPRGPERHSSPRPRKIEITPWRSGPPHSDQYGLGRHGLRSPRGCSKFRGEGAAYPLKLLDAESRGRGPTRSTATKP